MAGIQKGDQDKFLVLYNHSGKSPKYPVFVLGARDPGAAAALRAYAGECALCNLDPQYVHDMVELSEQFDRYREEHGASRPDQPAHVFEEVPEKRKTVRAYRDTIEKIERAGTLMNIMFCGGRQVSCESRIATNSLLEAFGVEELSEVLGEDIIWYPNETTPDLMAGFDPYEEAITSEDPEIKETAIKLQDRDRIDMEIEVVGKSDG